jgi:hypothetical protein
MKKKIIGVISLVVLLASSHVLHSQTPDPLSFFPHHLGDAWQRLVNPVSVQNVITKDSLGTDGKYYIEMSSDGKMRLDTTSLELHGQWWGGSVYSNLLLKLAAQQGEQWMVRRDPYVMLATVVAVFDAYILDTVVKVKQIDFADSGNGLLFMTYYWASSFGLVGEDIDAMPSWRLKGARIDGVQHGYVVSVTEESFETLPHSFILNQNYPNPFNPTTTIRFEIPQRSYVRLTVYDILGREVNLLVNKVEEAGYRSISFDASNLPSGIYFYRLQAGTFTDVKKMLMIK